MTDKKPAWRRPHKAKKADVTETQLGAVCNALGDLAAVTGDQKQAIADLRAAIRYTLSPDFPAPNDDAARIAYLRAWWSGENLRAVAEEPPSAKEDFQ